MHIKAVIFDFDGLLVDSEPLHFQSEKELFRSYGIELSPAIFVKGEGLSVVDAFEIYREHLHFTISTPELLKKKYDIFLTLVDTKLTRMPGVLELLDNLDRYNLSYAIATSGDKRYVYRALLKFSLMKRFSGRIVTVDQVAHGKPAPDVFLAAAHILGRAPRQCLVLEDSENGVRAALAAGMQIIHVAPQPLGTRDLSHVPHVSSLLEVLKKLKKALS